MTPPPLKAVVRDLGSFLALQIESKKKKIAVGFSQNVLQLLFTPVHLQNISPPTAQTSGPRPRDRSRMICKGAHSVIEEITAEQFAPSSRLFIRHLTIILIQVSNLC